jgi:hypothetical protein
MSEQRSLQHVAPRSDSFDLSEARASTPAHPPYHSPNTDQRIGRDAAQCGSVRAPVTKCTQRRLYGGFWRLLIRRRRRRREERGTRGRGAAAAAAAVAGEHGGGPLSSFVRHPCLAAYLSCLLACPAVPPLRPSEASEEQAGTCPRVLATRQSSTHESRVYSDSEHARLAPNIY